MKCNGKIAGDDIMLSYVEGGAAIVTLAAASIFGLAYVHQRKLIYIPTFPPESRQYVSTPDEFGMHLYENLTLKTKDDIKLHAYLIKQEGEYSKKAPTVIFLQANAGNMGHRLPIARVLFQNLRCNIFMLSYRGYGYSEGEPSEQGIQVDTQTALDFLLSNDQLDSSKFIVYGQSIGGAIAIDLIQRNPDKIQGLIIENTFLSMRKLIPHVIPVLSPFSFLCTEKWDSIRSIQTITCPILFLSGERDELIPPYMMKELYDNATSSKSKKLVTFPNGDHNETCRQPGYFDAIFNFYNHVFSDEKHKL